MTQEGVEIVRAAIEAWNRGDFEAWIGAWDERAEFHPFARSVEGAAYQGHDGLRRFVAEIAEYWEEVRFELDEIRGAGEQIAALGRVRARGRASGGAIWRLRSSGSCERGRSTTSAARLGVQADARAVTLPPVEPSSKKRLMKFEPTL